jgi:hypothetical protein
MSAPQQPILRFRSDGTFVVVQLTDIHWHDGEPEDERSRQLIERVLEAEQPDLVALTGDIVGGYASHDPGEALRQVSAPIIARGTPWAMAFGNHDDEGALSRLDLLRIQQDLPLCLTERGPERLTGIGNYCLRIASARSEALAAALYFLDSGSYTDTGIGQYAWIARNQIDWLSEEARVLNLEYVSSSFGSPHDPRLPALAFFHLPLPEYDEVWGSGTCRGHRHEPVCCPALNSGCFAALVEAGVLGVFVGHDHINDFEGDLFGVRLCYGRASGFASYGRADFARGARVIRLHEAARAFETWLRLDDGSTEGGTRCP